VEGRNGTDKEKQLEIEEFASGHPRICLQLGAERDLRRKET
jgi:hypothetical protein